MAKRSRLKTVAALMAASVALVGGWEGLRTVAYPDRIAGGIPTVCYGETRGVELGDSYTVEECKAMLGNALVEFETGMRACLDNPDAIPDKPYTSFVSLTYNIGVAGFCRSTVARRANAGDIEGACNAIPMWNKAGGRVVQGLVNRRAAEQKLCLEGVGGTITLNQAPPPPVTEAPLPPPAEMETVREGEMPIGIIVGGGFAVLVLGGLAIVLYRRRKGS